MSTETFDASELLENPIVSRQKEDVAKMRASLLSCTDDSGMSTTRAIQNITVMRVYHQLTRIIRYTELMDKLEDKLYSAIEQHIDESENDVSTIMFLLGVQEKLQKAMIESQKLLQPYMDIQNFAVVDLVDVGSSSTDSPITAKLMTSESRDKVRYKAQAVLDALGDAV